MRPRPTFAAIALALSLVGGTVGTSAPAGAAPRTEPSPFYNESSLPQLSGTYTPVVGDFENSSSYDDILWYAPGAGAEQFWTDTTDKIFTPKSLGNKVNGTYTPIVGDFTGDDLDDILWYSPGSGADSLWKTSGKATWTSYPVAINGTYAPVVLDDRDGKDDIIWSKPGGGVGSVWSFTGTGSQHVTHGVTTPADTKPLVGDFNGDLLADVFWYGPGVVVDKLWRGNGSGTFAVTTQSVGGTYQPLVLELDGGGPTKSHHPSSGGRFSPIATDDIFWFKPGGASSIWYGRTDGGWDQIPSVGVVGADGTLLPGKGNLTVFLWSKTHPDMVWSDGEIMAAHNTEFGAGYIPIVGNWFGTHEIVWYKPGSAPEVLFT